MTDLTRRYVRSAIGVVCGLLIATALLLLLENFGRAFLSGRASTMDRATSSFAAITTSGESVGTLSIHEHPQTISAIQFNDEVGRPLNLAEFHGKVVLLNVWATWCLPCRREMPTLDRLQAALDGREFDVVALSVDRAGIDVVRQFFGEIGITHLAMYIDRTGKSGRALNVVGLPTTLLVDRSGREIGRLVGPAEWDSPQVMEIIHNQLSRKNETRLRKQHHRAALPGSSDVSLGSDSSSSSTVTELVP